MRQAVEELVQMFSAVWSRDRSRTHREGRVPRRMRPHHPRSTFQPATDGKVSRRLAV
ncbi:hypothetical protein LG299_09120 [Microbacterium lacus]|uniref:hypothetical protein n=1 Tax=Microbacterium lacus TaxID=415217 RepID=UPI00384AD9A6